MWLEASGFPPSPQNQRRGGDGAPAPPRFWVGSACKSPARLSGKVDAMNHVRGFVMLLAAGFAVWKGWKIHSGPHAWMAYGLAVAALALAVWHLTRRDKRLGTRD
jgi:hypothetical protein